MINLLAETREAIADSGHTPEDIVFIGSLDSGHRCTWDEFIKLTDAPPYTVRSPVNDLPDLASFVLARIAEDEVDAQALADTDDATWTAATDVGDHYNFGVVTTATPQTLTRSYDGGLLISGSDTVVARVGIEGWDWDDAEVRARHIARHDPAHVLAWCVAIRTIVDEFGQLGRNRARLTDAALHLKWNVLRAVVQQFAAIWPDHPDFRPEWSPAETTHRTPG